MKKILYIFLLNEDDVGPKVHVNNILKNSKHDIRVLTWRNDNIWNNYLARCIKPVFKINFLNIQLFQMIAILYVLKNYKKYDVILIRQSIGFFLMPFIFKVIKKKVILELNGLPHQDLIDRGRFLISKLYKTLEKFSYKYSTILLCVHDNIKSSLETRFPQLGENKIHIIENGVELTNYVSSYDAKKTNNIDLNEVRIGYLGSHAHREGVEYFVDMALSLPEANVKFVVLGGNSQDVESFRKLVKKSKVHNSFELYEYQPLKKALKVLQTCDICVHMRRPIDGASDSQGSPLKMLDYHNIGRFVFASKISSYNYIQEMSLGELFNLNSKDFIEKIVRRIKYFSDNIYSEDLVKKGYEAHKYIQKKSWKNQIAEFDRLVNKIL